MNEDNKKPDSTNKTANLERLLQSAYHAFYKETNYEKAAAFANELLKQSQGLSGALLYGDWRKQAKFLLESIKRKIATQKLARPMPAPKPAAAAPEQMQTRPQSQQPQPPATKISSHSSYGRLFATSIKPGNLAREQQVLDMHFVNTEASLARAEEFLQNPQASKSLETVQSHITGLYKELEIIAQLHIPAALSRDKDGLSPEDKRQRYFERIATAIDRLEKLIFAQK